ncbi:MAG: FG-GAP repeat protein [Deltaproteobacteria bacterium]|nr:FG-GAP repeat protein [Deltaproteobacteria bacterium]
MTIRRLLGVFGTAALLAACGGVEGGDAARDDEGQREFAATDPAIKATLDVNGDGYADLAVSGASREVHIYHGGPAGLPSTPSMTLQSPSEEHYTALAAAGDVDKDGYGDLIVASKAAGVVSLFRGSASGLAQTASQILQVSGEVSFGTSLAGGADLNADGYPDVAISAMAGNNQRGRVYVYSGGPGGLRSSPMLVLSGASNAWHFGYAMDMGDLNGDKYADLVISENAWGFTPAVGRVHIYWGNGTFGGPISLLKKKTLSCPDGPQQGFGVSVTVVKDYNKDGGNELAVGAYAFQKNTGRVYLYHGLGRFLAKRPQTFSPAGTGGFFGWAVRAGDLDADGHDELIIGESDAASLRGQAHVYHYHGVVRGMFSGRALSAHSILQGAHSGVGYFGNTLAMADYNGDGATDLVVGAPMSLLESRARVRQRPVKH